MPGPDSSEIHFLADLHLSPEAPGITRLFLDYLAGDARGAGQVFILGDLFEAWPGDDLLDDQDEPFAAEIAAQLKTLCDSGTAVSVQHGNRDFLLGERFAEASGSLLLPDPYTLTLPAARFVLAHGDALCTDDADYQAFRRQVRDPGWRNAFLQKPLAERKAIAAAMRRQSEMSKREKSASLMDLNPAATEDFLRRHGHATFIHGHTHQPAVHTHTVDGIRVDRWVLADWQENRGEYLAWDGRALARHVLET